MARWSALDENGAPDFSLLQERISELRAGRAAHVRPARLPAIRPALHDGRSLLEVPLESRKRLLKTVLREHPRVRFASRRRQRAGLPCRRQGARPRGDRGQAADLALRARPTVECMAQDQDPARAGARRRRLDARRRECPRPRRARDRCLRGRGASLFRQGGFRLRRRDPQAAARTTRAARQRRSAVRPPTRAQGRAAQRDVGPARACHPRRARRLVPRQPRSADLVQGDRGRPRSDDRLPRARGRDRCGGWPPKRRQFEADDGGPPMPKSAPKTARTNTRGPRRRGARALDARQGGRLAGRRPGPQAHQPRQGAVPALEGSGEEPITKRELIRYFARSLRRILPHLADRR